MICEWLADNECEYQSAGLNRRCPTCPATLVERLRKYDPCWMPSGTATPIMDLMRQAAARIEDLEQKLYDAKLEADSWYNAAIHGD